MVRSGKQFRDQAHEDRLETQNKKHNAQLEEWRAKDGNPLNDLTNNDYEQQDTASGDQCATSAAKEAHRLVGIIEKKLYSEQIQDDLDRSFQAVFCLTEFAGMMVDGNLCDARSDGMCKDRDEAVHLTIQTESL